MSEEFFSKQPEPGLPWDVVIIGSGPSSLTAAIYTTRGAASTLILGGEKWGGQLMLTSIVDNFPGFPEGIMGPDLMELMKKQAERFGALFKAVNVESVDFSGPIFKLTAGGETYSARSVLIATGAESVWLGVPGESNLIGRGVSSCAPCDAPFFKKKKVIVVGGGDAAMEEALILTKYASEVTVVHRRDTFRASHAMKEKVLNNPKIKVLWNTEILEMIGNQKLESVKIKNNLTQEIQNLEIDGVFVAVGHIPSAKIFEGKVDLDEKGYVKKSENQGYKTSTNVLGVFVAGDVHDFHFKQAITAAGFGCMASLEILKYLEEKALTEK